MRDMLFAIPFVALTALCWGIYGPVLHEGQSAMGQSRLRPLLCVGMAYFVIAVIVPIVMLQVGGEKGSWSTSGIIWSSAAGAAGAIGALGIILALNMGGTPSWVMPLVFGFAPIVNTLYVTSTKRLWDQISPFYLAGMIMVIAGAMVVLVFAPKPAKAAKGNTTATPAAATSSAH